jgi:hypothetical protein
MIRRIFTEEEVFDLELKAHGQVQYDLGLSAERLHIIALLEEYFDLTRFSVEVEGASENKEWDAGFQSAIALIKGENK